MEQAIVKGLDRVIVMDKVAKLELKRGDEIFVSFTNGEEEVITVERVGYIRRQARDNKLIEDFTIKGKDGVLWNVWNMKYIEVLSRSKRSKKVLTEDLIQFNHTIKFYLAQAKARQGYLEKKKQEQAEGIVKAPSKTKRELLEEYVAEEGLVIGCCDPLIDRLSQANIKHLGNFVKYRSATDVVINHGLAKYVVSIDFVDNEVDFTTLTKAEYISRYGEEKFLDC